MGAAVHETGGVPEWRRLVALTFFVQLCSMMGVSITFSFLPLFIETLGVSPAERASFWAGVMMFSQGIMVALASPVWGSFADRVGAKLMVCRALFGASVVYVAISFVTDVYWLVPLFALAGLFTGINTAITNLVSSFVPRAHLGSAIGAVQTGVFMGVAIGPLIGGVLADAFGYRIGLRTGALLLSAGGMLVVFSIRERPRTRSISARRPGFLDGIRQTSRSRPLMILIAIIFVVQFSTHMIQPVMPVYIREIAGERTNVATVVGLVLALGGVGSACGSFLIGRLADRLGQRRLLGFSIVGGSIALALQAAAGALVSLAGARVLVGFFAGGLHTGSSAAVGTMAPAASRGAAFGVAGSAFSFGNAFGPLLGGALAGALSPRAVIAISALILLAGRLLIIPLDRAATSVPASDEQPAAAD